MSDLEKSALWYAKLQGWLVIPLNGKTPIIKDWPNRATTDPELICAWWRENPRSNVGILCGRKSCLVVIDIDPRNGGKESFDALLSELGPLPQTPMVLTGGGGIHLYFRYPSANLIPKSKPSSGIDIQSDGSQVVAPPSIHPTTGRLYVWEESARPDQIPLAELPQKWLDFLSGKQGVRKPSTSPSLWRDLIQNGAQEGSRNDTAARLAGHLFSKRVDPFVVLELIQAWNEARNSPPLPDSEVVRTVNSVAGAELRKRGGHVN